MLSVAARAGQVSAPQHKSVPLLIKSADDQGGTFTGLASVVDNLDHDGDIARRGAFSKSPSSGTSIPLAWMQKADDPRFYFGDVIEATETDHGLAIKGRLIATPSSASSPTETRRAAECQV